MDEEEDEKTGDRQQETGNRQPAMRRGADIAQRLLRLGVAAIRLVGQMPSDAAGRHVSHQLLRSTTSSGANYEEARAAESTADFIHKLSISAKEMRETCYWLGLVAQSGWIQGELQPMVREATELAAILGASVRTARGRSKKER